MEINCVVCRVEEVYEVGDACANCCSCPECVEARAGRPPILQHDPVNSPKHYNQDGIECIDAIKAALGPEGFQSYMMGNVIKYSWRYKYKNGIEDLKKARWYLDRTISEMENEA